jgi:predicted phage terminase large subunit-like protein
VPDPLKVSCAMPFEPTHAQLEALRASLGEEGLAKLRYRRDVRQSLALFFQDAWKEILPHTELVWNWHLDVICKHLERVARQEETRLLINVPPGHSKSTAVSVMFQAWVWLTTPWYRTIYSSYDEGLVLRDAEYMRRIVRSEWYQGLIPARFGKQKNEKWTLDKNQSALSFYQNSESGYRFSTTVRGASTGWRGDAIIVDDAQKAGPHLTPEAMEKVAEWWDKEMSSRVADETKSAYVIIGQRLHHGDLAGHIMGRDEEEAAAGNKDWHPYTKIVLPSEFNPEMKERYNVVDDPRSEPGELLFEARHPQKALDEAKRKLGPYDYSAQHDQNPTPRGAGIFDLSKVIFWYPHDELPPKDWKEEGATEPNVVMPLPISGWSAHAQSWDCAFKDKATSDFVCGLYLRRRGSQIFVIDMRLGRMSFTKTVETMKQCNRDWPKAIAKYVEDKANGSAVIDHLRKEVMGLIEVNPESGKLARAQATSPLFYGGNVVFPHPNRYPWARTILEQMRQFPKGKNDDIVDAFTQGALKLYTGGYEHLRALAKR